MRKRYPCPGHLGATVLFAVFTALAFPLPADAVSEPHGTITLRQALALALEGSPKLAAFSWDIRAAEARIIQASLRPNPELSLAIEEVRWTSGPGTVSDTVSMGWALTEDSVSVPMGEGQEPVDIPIHGAKSSTAFERVKEQGARSGFSEAEFTLSLSQVIELGGKRAKRLRVAQRERELAQWDYEAARADVTESVAATFVSVLAAQERYDLRAELLGLAERVHQAVSKQVKAGAVSPLEENRAQLALDSMVIERERAARELDAARAALCATWGQARPSFERAAGRLDEIADVPPWERLESGIRGNPDVARWAAEMARRDAALKLTRAQSIPNPTLEIGIRSAGVGSKGASAYSLDTEGSFALSRMRSGGESPRDNSLVLGFSVPLPLFDRNQGNIREAECLIRKAREERRATESSVFAALAEAHQALLAAHGEIRVLAHRIIPCATDTFEKTQEGYRQGKFGYLEVLEAERTLFDAREQYLDALTAYHTWRVRLERLTGLPLSTEWASNREVIHETKQGD